MEQIYFVLTDQCNLQCSHCIRDSSPWRKEAADADLMLRVLGSIAQDYPSATVLLTGGEPTVYRQFDAILQHAIGLNLDVIINSNGTTSFYKEKNLQTIAAYRKLSVQISLDGIQAVHDEIRGQGSYQRALRSIERLIRAGLRTSVSATAVSTDFLENAAAFIQGLDHLGLNHIAIKRVTYAGRAAEGSALDTDAWNQAVYRLRRLAIKTPLWMHPMYDFARLDQIDDDSLRQLKPNPSTVNCGAGTAKAYIYPNGDVCACTCFREHPIGNVSRQSLHDILSDYAPLQVNDGACLKCRYLSLCRGGCLGSGYQHTRTLGKADPRCARTGRLLKRIALTLI